MESFDTNTALTNSYSCDGCGAPLVYKPGTDYLVCEHCGSRKKIDQIENIVVESDFNAYIENFEKENFNTTKVVVCSNCKATPTVDENLKSMSCPYCGSPLVEQNIHQERYIKPDYVSPFRVDKSQINDILAKWINSLWFAPNKIRKAALSPLNLNGIYVPFWTFDANTVTNYVGERGNAYYVTVGSGKNRRTVRRVNWTRVRGTVRNFYDDILISGSHSLDSSLLTNMGGWNTHNILQINDSYLAGFITEKYQVDLKQAFVFAKQQIEGSERYSVRADIGGDEQRVHTMETSYFNVTFKHVLLPIYISAFRYKDKLYTFYVNGTTGQISGERPYSKIKIALAVIVGILIAIGIYYFVSQYQQ